MRVGALQSLLTSQEWECSPSWIHTLLSNSIPWFGKFAFEDFHASFVTDDGLGDFTVSKRYITSEIENHRSRSTTCINLHVETFSFQNFRDWNFSYIDLVPRFLRGGAGGHPPPPESCSAPPEMDYDQWLILVHNVQTCNTCTTDKWLVVILTTNLSRFPISYVHYSPPKMYGNIWHENSTCKNYLMRKIWTTVLSVMLIKLLINAYPSPPAV